MEVRTRWGVLKLFTIRGVMLNLASLISASIWKPEESDCQRFNVELGSNLITVRGVY